MSLCPISQLIALSNHKTELMTDFFWETCFCFQLADLHVHFPNHTYSIFISFVRVYPILIRHDSVSAQLKVFPAALQMGVGVPKTQ